MLANNVRGLSKEQLSYLLRIKDQADTLKSKMLDLKGMTYFSMKDAEKVSDFIAKLKMNLNFPSEMNSPSMGEIVDRLNKSLGCSL